MGAHDSLVSRGKDGAQGQNRTADTRIFRSPGTQENQRRCGQKCELRSAPIHNQSPKFENGMGLDLQLDAPDIDRRHLLGDDIC